VKYPFDKGKSWTPALSITGTSIVPHLPPTFKGLKVYKKEAFSLEVHLLIKYYQCMKEEIKLIVFLPRQADTLLPAGGNRDAKVLWRETTCGWAL